MRLRSISKVWRNGNRSNSEFGSKNTSHNSVFPTCQVVVGGLPLRKHAKRYMTLNSGDNYERDKIRKIKFSTSNSK